MASTASQSGYTQVSGLALGFSNFGTATSPNTVTVATLDANGNLVLPGVVVQNAGGTSGLGGVVQYLPLLDFHATTGAALAVASATNAFYQQITAGTNAQIQSATTSAAQNTCGMIFEDLLSTAYVGGTAPLTVVINCQRTLAGTATLSQCNLLVNFYPKSAAGSLFADLCNGTSVALAAGTLAQTVTFTATNVSGTAGISTRQDFLLKVTGTFQETATANGSILINSVSLQ